MTDVCVVGVSVYFLDVETRCPLKFGQETLTSVTCCRVRMTVRDRHGRLADGWGETPLSVQWAWPSNQSYASRHRAMRQYALQIGELWARNKCYGHPIELGYDFLENVRHQSLGECSASADGADITYLAAMVCASSFDIALHDAYSNLHGLDVYHTYTKEFMSRDLAAFLTPLENSPIDFHGQFPGDYLAKEPLKTIPVWHLVGGLDRITTEDEGGDALLDDGYPTTLADWIGADGLRCLKVKLRGNDGEWDYHRLVRVAETAFPLGVKWLSADFNCTVDEPGYVNEILDRLRDSEPDVFAHILYVEQPFPYDLEEFPIDVRSLSARKPLFLDESADDWQSVRLGRSLGWSGVCLKTCKSQTGSLLSLCWAKAHGMPIMVQDLTNPMLAQIPHLRLASYANTIMGVESNAMQFYPRASLPEAAIHPGMYRRSRGLLNLESLGTTGFGYRADEIVRTLPKPAGEFVA